MPEADGLLKSRSAKICGGLLFLFIILRLGIFGVWRKPVTEKQYDRPIALDQFVLTGADVPSPFALADSSTEGKATRIVPAKEALDALPPKLDLPDLAPVGKAALVRFKGATKAPAFLLVLVLKSSDDAKRIADALGTDETRGNWKVGAFAQDDRIILGVASSPASPAPLLAALRKKTKARKVWRRKIEKLRVIGNAILKMLIDILVFGFVFVVILFLCKWVFILRPLQE